LANQPLCDPDLAEELRDTYDSVIPAFHMNKKHWNTIIVNGQLNARQLREMIDASYTLVVKSLPAGERKKLEKS
jgi:predicted DNA-binding protein (MmcQ/YjbR family)